MALEKGPVNYDALIIGAGHNGLVTTCYLARAGWKVLVLERRQLVGGACVTEETFPGFKVSTAAYVNSLFHTEIIRDLKLNAYGYEVLARDPSSFTPFPDGRSLMMGPDADLTRKEISKFSARDAERYPEYETMLERVAALVEPTLTMPPPDVVRPRLADLRALVSLGLAFRRLRDGAGEAVEILTGAARPILDRWFESEELKGTLATDAIIGALAGAEPGPQHRGTIHICPDPDYIERAFDDAKYGRPSTEPVLECTIPSAVDRTVAPPGKHLMSMFVQYAPYELRNGSWDDQRDAFADRCFDLLDEYAPNFKNAVLDRQVLTPLDLERVFNLTGGNIFQGAMTPGQLFAFRPVPGYARYRTPLRGLYLCGAAAHPGGGVLGTPGLNAAREILGRRRLRARRGRKTARSTDAL